MQKPLAVRRLDDVIIAAHDRRVVLKRFFPSSLELAARIIDDVSAACLQSPESTETHLRAVLASFGARHRDLLPFLQSRGSEVLSRLGRTTPTDNAAMAVIGSYFVHEYSIEGAALFNPSLVMHPDQSGLDSPSDARVVVSLRACGEGHVSSITFVEAIWRASAGGGGGAFEIVAVDPQAPLSTGVVTSASTSGGGVFSNPVTGHEFAVPDGTYSVQFDNAVPLDQRVLFPAAQTQSNGVEDARFVQFRGPEGGCSDFYAATFTAYDGKHITPQLVITRDFARFDFKVLRGSGVSNKGMALFPRKVAGRYVMLSRQDDRSVWIMVSDDIECWDDKQLLLGPEQPWELFKMGNCGSPVETSEGWIVITHGVGAMRKYCLGAALLDLDDPTKVIGRLREPLIVPNEAEREGYVPNVVYSCGSMLHGGDLIIPYAMSDSRCSVATVRVADLLAALR